MVGDAGVGKTNILLRYMSNEYDKHSKATLGVEFSSKYLKMDPRMPPKTPQEGPRRPKDNSRRPQAPPKTAPRPSKDAPGSAQGAAGASKGALRVAPRSAQEPSKIGFSPRTPPGGRFGRQRAAQDANLEPKCSEKGSQREPRGSKNEAREPTYAKKRKCKKH